MPEPLIWSLVMEWFSVRVGEKEEPFAAAPLVTHVISFLDPVGVVFLQLFEYRRRQGDLSNGFFCFGCFTITSSLNACIIIR
ncbi:hypothetical protein GK047_26005 [Paenibacillus sp. SYP-B3998]|uniref:Uncharacterized protein n=1 Tax=Paenibacillus sp. SYP-B3998 TaxID=2678564 RepID=A0A6G4A6E9_9BACL|nr:hypothetical protein [Paenibacillus sp. SYP-B3998]NEW09401.1 hypothetical protein [Paenibacillus sp. SYP-B3998]